MSDQEICEKLRKWIPFAAPGLDTLLEIAAQRLESLQRERQEPEPLEALELDDFVAKPVFCVDSKSKTREWRIIESAYIDYSDYDCSCFVLSGGSRETEITGMDITSGAVKLYATEPKGEHHD